MGMQIFSGIRQTALSGLTPVVNFNNFGSAVFLLIRYVTGTAEVLVERYLKLPTFSRIFELQVMLTPR